MFIVTISPWLEATLLFVLISCLLLLSSERQLNSIRLVALQGGIMGAMPVLVSLGRLNAMIIGTGILFFSIKAVILPYILKKAHDGLPPQAPSNPYIGHKTCVFLGFCGFAFSMWMGRRLAIPDNLLLTAFFPIAFGSMFSGLLLIISRRTAFNQVIGYLVLENGIYLLGVPLTGHDSMWIELSTLLDICVAVFIMGIALNRISHAFESADVDNMALLKD